MKIILEDEKQRDSTAAIPENGQPFRIKDSARSKRCIFQNVSSTIQTSLINFESATDMWDHLYRTYSGKNNSRKNQGIRKLALFKYTESTIEKNVERIIDLANFTAIASNSDDISIQDLAIHVFLNSLPTRFSNIRTSLESKTEPLDMAAVRSALVDEEERHKEREAKEFSGAVMSSNRCSHNRPQHKCWTCHPELHPSKQTCKDCKMVGHYSAKSYRCKSNSNSNSAAFTNEQRRKSSDESFPSPQFAEYVVSTSNEDLRHSIKEAKRKRI